MGRVRPDEEQPVGTIGLCQICHRAVQLRRHQGSDTTDEGETVTWDYLAWEHFHRWPNHDAEPMRSPLDSSTCPRCARTMYLGHCCCGYTAT